MEYGTLAAQYRQSAALVREREQHLVKQPAEELLEARYRRKERIVLLKAEYVQLTQVALHLERYARKAGVRCR